MKKIPSTLLWGILLIVLGLLALLSNLNVLGNASDLVWGVLFAAVGVAFLFLFVQNRDHWCGRCIPGLGAVGLGLLIIVGDWMPGESGAVLFLGPWGWLSADLSGADASSGGHHSRRHDVQRLPGGAVQRPRRR